MHDAAYKLLFSHPRMVADLLRGFLPDGEWPGFDFGSLEPLPASHVGRGLRRREGDRMWRLRARAAPDGGWAHVLLLMEFQSSVDKHMALRVMTYTGLAWEGLLRWREGSGGEEPPGAPLPQVIPLVVYMGNRAGRRRWDVSEAGRSDGAAGPGAAAAVERLRAAGHAAGGDRQCAGGQRGRFAGGAGAGHAGRVAAACAAAKLKAALAGPDLAELRRAFAAWLRRSYEKDYGVFADAGEAVRDELDRMEKAGEVVEMGSLALETGRNAIGRMRRGFPRGRWSGV